LFSFGIQLDVANRFIDYHTKQFGFSKQNVEFRLGKIEQLTDDPELKSNSFDVVAYVFIVSFFLFYLILLLLFRSNCVVNLCPDKKKVLQQVYEMLKVSCCIQMYIECLLLLVAWR
jgi:arsenite methyltransferase